MAERRPLTKGLEDIQVADREREEEFVYGQKPPRSPAKAVPREPKPISPAQNNTPAEPHAPPPLPESVVAAAQLSAPSPLIGVGRTGVGARVRTELAAALKRASLERQLKGQQPFTVQEILEDALGLWLLKNGHSK